MLLSVPSSVAGRSDFLLHLPPSCTVLCTCVDGLMDTNHSLWLCVVVSYAFLRTCPVEVEHNPVCASPPTDGSRPVFRATEPPDAYRRASSTLPRATDSYARKSVVARGSVDSAGAPDHASAPPELPVACLLPWLFADSCSAVVLPCL